MVDYDKIAGQIIKFVGGKENISKLIHCSTRLRFSLKDVSKANLEELKQISGVLGAINSSGQCQVIIGNNVVEMYDAINKQFGQVIARNEENHYTNEKWYQILLDYLIAIFQPLIPAIAGGGVLKALTMLFGMLGWISQSSSFYQMLNFIGKSPLYFFPILLSINT